MPDEIPQKSRSSIWTKIIVLIIIGLLVWQFGVPYIDSSIKLPSDYINDTFFSDNADSNWSIYVLDVTTGARIDMLYPANEVNTNAYYTQLTAWHAYDIYISYNLKPNIFGEFTYLYSVRIIDENGTISPYYPFGGRIPGYAPLYSSTEKVNKNFTINYENDYTILADMSFYNTNGIRLPYANTNNTLVWIYLQSPYVVKTPGIFYN